MENNKEEFDRLQKYTTEMREKISEQIKHNIAVGDVYLKSDGSEIIIIVVIEVPEFIFGRCEMYIFNGIDCYATHKSQLFSKTSISDMVKTNLSEEDVKKIYRDFLSDYNELFNKLSNCLNDYINKPE